VFALVGVLITLPTSRVAALILEIRDRVNSQAPPDDPGWANVGICDRWTAVYLGGGWVLTARHVGPAKLILEGVEYSVETGSKRIVLNSDATAADLVLFRITSEPELSTIQISKSPPPVGSPIMMIGAGFSQAGRVFEAGRAGYRWSKRTEKLWGTNRVFQILHDQAVGNTDTFSTRFSIAKTRFEANAARGDSGGAAFVYAGNRWELAGTILAMGGTEKQTDRTTLYGNHTFIADLSRYRDFIHRVTGLYPD
jgi:secreted trypsin-like serine protease